MQIMTKFTVGTEEGITALLMLTRQLAHEKFSSLLKKNAVDKYIDEHFNEKTLINELNSLSNQWLVVYVDDNPAGFARVTSKGKKPDILTGRRAIRIADFGILKAYSEPAVRESLFEKCLTVCKFYESIWINEYDGNPLIDFYEHNGFSRQPETCQLDELPLTSIFLIKQRAV